MGTPPPPPPNTDGLLATPPATTTSGDLNETGKTVTAESGRDRLLELLLIGAAAFTSAGIG
ncbi:hypothetical protein, partial [Rhodococcus tibetensis]